MAILFALLLLPFLVQDALGFSDLDEPTTTTITSIEFDGGESIGRKKLDALIKVRIGQAYDPDLVREDLKKLSTVARTVEARKAVKGGGWALIYALSPNPQIGHISFVGNSRLTTKHLTGVVPVKDGDPLAASTTADCRDKILADYRSAGYSQTTVEAQPIENADGSVSLQFLINEGDRLKINTVKIVGAKSKSALSMKLSMKSKGSWMCFDNFFDKAAFKQDIERLAQRYIADGYFAAKVRQGEFIYDSDKRQVTPVILIDEGPRYTVKAIGVEGATLFSSIECLEPFRALADSHYDGAKFAKAGERLRDLYAKEGYLLAGLDEDYAFEKESASATVVVKITEGPRIRVGKVRIEREARRDRDGQGGLGGLYRKIAPPVSDQAILREVRLKPGEIYRKEHERDTVRRLESLEIFDHIKARSEPTGQDNVHDLVLHVDEKRTGSVNFGVGYGEAAGAGVFATYAEKNLFGEARDLRAQVGLGTRTVSGSIGYLDRHWRGEDRSLAVDLFRTSTAFRGYAQTDTGAQVEMGRAVNESLRRYLRFRLAYTTIDKLADVREPLNDYAVATVRKGFIKDTRDSTEWPSAGGVQAAGMEMGYAGGPLLKLTGGLAVYRKLRERYIYALNMQGGFMPLKASDVGIGERFFLGGAEDLRGFALRGAGPMDDGSSGVAIGGSNKLSAQNELRFAILDDLGISKREMPVRGLVFGDIGLIGRNPLEIGAPRASVGAGVRVGEKVGLDLALPVISQRDDLTQFFHFKLSNPF